MQPTERETDILTGLIQGQSNKEIAQALSISDHTVRDHVSRLLRKFNVANRTELVARYLSRREQSLRSKANAETALELEA